METKLGVQVENFESPRSGKPVSNQYKVYTNAGVFFQSYNTVIAFKDNAGKVFVTDAWDYSQTTLKYLKQFLRTSLSKKDLQARIDAGEIELVDSLSAH